LQKTTLGVRLLMKADLADPEFKAWLESEGYYALRNSPLGIVGLHNFIATIGICVGIGKWNYRYRFCYQTLLEAVSALNDWDYQKFEGEPAGFLVRKGEGGDRRGPGSANRMVTELASDTNAMTHFLWRDLSGEFHPLGSMDIPTVHCALRMLRNHQAPVPLRHPYIKEFDERGPGAWSLDSFYTPDYCSLGIVAMIRHLLAQQGLPVAIREDLCHMQGHFAAVLTPVARAVCTALKQPITPDEWDAFGYAAYYEFIKEYDQKPSVSFVPTYRAPEWLRDAVLAGWFRAKSEN
jgi:hypothetical protein